MDFPKPTKDLAEKVAAELRRQRGSDSFELARGVYEFLNNRFDYGFLEGLYQGLFIRYPHEIVGEWECIESAVYTYALTEALCLEPRMMKVKKWMNFNTGHETVDVKVNGDRVLIDPLNDMFGRVSYTDGGIVVEDNPITRRCIMPCSRIEEIPKNLILARMEYYRSDEGILNLLISGQKFSVGLPPDKIFVFYNPNTQVFELQLRQNPPFLEPAYINQQYHISRNGLRSMSLEHGIYDREDWLGLIGQEPFWKVTTQDGHEKVEWFVLRQYGLAYLLRDLLYEELIDKGFRDKIEGLYLFDHRERPLEKLSRKIDEIQAKGISADNKHIYFDLRRAYISAIMLDQDMHTIFQIWMDRATLNSYVKMAAKENGMSIVAMYKKILERIGSGREDYTGPSFVEEGILQRPLNEFELFKSTYESLRPFFDRLTTRGMVR